MANQAVTLKDPVTGDLLYPATVSSQVFNEDGTSFKDTVESLKTSVSEGKSLIAAAVTDKGVQTAADATFATMAANIAGIKTSSILAPSSTTIGDTIVWDHKDWLVCEYDSTNNWVYLISPTCVGLSKYYSENAASITYAESILAQTVKNYEDAFFSEDALSKLVDTTVNDVTSKVFIPSYEQMLYSKGGFSWFTSNSRRSFYIYYTNWTMAYWTSSPYNKHAINIESSSGSFNFTADMTQAYGVRPCICVDLNRF